MGMFRVVIDFNCEIFAVFKFFSNKYKISFVLFKIMAFIQ